MKKRIFIPFLLATLTWAVNAQTQKQIFPESLTGGNFKVLSMKAMQARFRVSLSGGIVFPEDRETISIATELFESQAHTNPHEIILNPDPNNSKRSTEQTFGLAFGYQWSEQLELSGSIGYGNSRIQTSFTVLQPPPPGEWPNTEPGMVERRISAEASRWQGMAGAVWHFGRGILRPSLGAGLHFTRTNAPDLGYEQEKIGGFAQAGLDVFVAQRVFLSVSGQMRTNAPSMVQGGVGYLFR